MIKKLLKKVRNLFARRKVIRPQPVRLRNRKPYIGVPAQYPTPYDPWFATQVKTAKQRIADQLLALEEAIRKEQCKEPDNIHETFYKRSSQHWSTWTEGVSGSGAGR